MTTAVDRAGTHRVYRLGWWRILRSELIRIVTVRSSTLTLGGFALVMVVVGVVAAATATGEVSGVGPGGGPAPGASGTDPLTTVLAGQTPGVLVLGVLGVLVGAREYSSGMIRTTMAAVPSRWRVLVARIGAYVAVTGPVALAATGVAYIAGSAVLDAGDAAVAQWSDDGVPRAVLGTAVYLVGVGVLGVSLGVLSRSIGAGVGWLVGLVLVVPAFASLLLPEDYRDVVDYLPSAAGGAFTSVADSTDGLTPGAGAVVYLAWVVAAAALAGTALTRRDV